MHQQPYQKATLCWVCGLAVLCLVSLNVCSAQACPSTISSIGTVIDGGTLLVVDSFGISTITLRSLVSEGSGQQRSPFYTSASSTIKGMHYDYNRQRIYLTTSKMEIRQLNLSLSSGLPNLNVTVLNDQVLFNRTGTLTNIAVDWINDELYWVESNPQGACQIMHADATRMVSCSFVTITPLCNISLSVDAFHGYLYWSDIGGVLRVPLATARNSTCVQPTTGSYIVPNVPQTLVSVDLMANKLYYLYSTSFIYSTPINGTSNQTYTCVVDEGVPALLLTTFGTMVVVYSELYFFVDGSAAQPQFVPLIMQYMHANLQPFPCPPSPPTLFQVQSTSTTATVSWSPPRSSPTVLYPCAAGSSGFSNWLYTLSYGPVGGPQATVRSTYAQSLTLPGLQPGSLYQFSVNVTGLSPVTQVSTSYVFATSKTGTSNIILATIANLWLADMNGANGVAIGPASSTMKSNAIAYDSNSGDFYWTATDQTAVFQQLFSGNSSSLYTNLQLLSNLKYDWISRRLYWIQSSSLNSNVRSVVAGGIGTVRDLKSFTALAVDPYQGVLFWLIEGVVTMKPINGLWPEQTCISNISPPPQALAVNPVSQTLYWASVTLDGSPPSVGSTQYSLTGCNTSFVNITLTDISPPVYSTLPSCLQAPILGYALGKLYLAFCDKDTVYSFASNLQNIRGQKLAIQNISFAGQSIRDITFTTTEIQPLPTGLSSNQRGNVTLSIPGQPSASYVSGSTIILTWSPASLSFSSPIWYVLTYLSSSLTGAQQVQVSVNNAVITGLVPNTTLTSYVVAYSLWGASQPSANVTVKLISVPSPIQNVRVYVYNPLRQGSNLSALVVWDPSQEVANNYSIKVSKSGTLVVQITVQGNYSQTSIFARGSRNELQYVLMANTTYSVTVVASNNAGTSNLSIPVNFTTYAPSSSNVVLAIGATTITSGADSVSPMNLQQPLAVNTIGREVYSYSSSRPGVLQKMNINGRNQLPLISAKGLQMLGNVTAMAYDWVGERVYLIDSNGGQLTLWRVPTINPDGLERVAPLVAGSSVTSLVVDPFGGYVYWSTSSLAGVQTLNLRTNMQSSFSRKRRQVALATSPLALALDPVSGALWISTGAGHILTYTSGTLKVVVNATALSVGSNIGLPATSLTLDEYRLYWTNSNSSGIFYVFRNNTGTVYTLSYYSGSVSAIFSTSPGQQPLPPVECLSYDPSNAAQLLKANQTSSNSTTVLITWSAPLPSSSCPMTMLNYPALQYRVQLSNGVSYPLSVDTQYLLTQLTPYTVYQVTVFAFNQYTIAFNSSYYDSTMGVVLSPQPSSYTTIMTREGVPNAPQVVSQYSNSTRTIFIGWRPATSADLMGNISRLLYYVQIGAQSLSTLYTNYTLTGLLPGTYLISVITSNGVFNSMPAIVSQSTWPLPPTPTPVIQNTTNTSVVFTVDVGSVVKFISSYYVTVYMYSNGVPVRTLDSVQTSAGNSQVQIFTVSGLSVFTNYTIIVYGTYVSNDHEESVPQVVTTGPGVPDPPVISVNSMDYLTWPAFRSNIGSAIMQYRLYISAPGIDTVRRTIDPFNDVKWENDQYIYTTTTIKTLLSLTSIPSGTYTLTMFATNAIGESNGSLPVKYQYTSSSVSLEMIGIIIGVSTGGFVLFTVVIFTIVICCVIARQRNRRGRLSMYAPDQELSDLRKNYKAYSSNPQYAWSREDYICTDEDLDLLQKFPRSNLKLENFIDRGEFGEVFQGTATDILGPGTGPIPVAVKTLRKGAVIEEQKKFLAEAALMGNFNHPNIVKVLGVCVENDPVYIIMELMPGGDLLHFLRDARVEHGSPLLTMKELIQIGLDVAQGCRYLQQAHFIHRDLAARNCLVSSKGSDRVVKIGDFGLAKDLYSSDYYQVEGQRKLPVRWMAPEALLQGKFNMESDVWSFGVLMWEIMTFGNQPYPALNNQEVLQFVTAEGRLEKPDNCPGKIYHLMQNCWKKVASERPHFEVIMEILSNYLEHLRRDSVSSDGDSDDAAGNFERQGSKKSKNSSIRSGKGILSLARQGSMKLRNSLRRHGSVHRKEDQGTNNPLSVSSSENLVERENNASQQAVERGPF